MTSNEATTIRKRVGGGYKYVQVKSENREHPPDTKDRAISEKLNNSETTSSSAKSRDTMEEKHELESTEKESNKSSRLTSIESLSLPLSRVDLREDTEPGDAVRYDDHPILRYIQDHVIGHHITVHGPFGTKRVVYCDFTASGRSLSFIEDYIRTFVCPFYANTHSDAGHNARQTSKFREEARDIVRQCCNATKDDAVIFTGSGATAGLHKLAWALRINQPRVAEETVVLIGPYEHHANMLLWKEFGATVIRIKECAEGTVDLDHFNSELKFWREKKRLMLVCMSAASNVTGIVTDTERIAEISHQYGALVAFDYAGGGPYLDIDMNPSKKGCKDAVCISPHKFVGGPGSPGILIAKKWVFRNHIPDRVGGGTVVYVSRDIFAYTSNIEAREEGGTPAIIESIRTGLVFQLKRAVGVKLIAARDRDLCRRAFSVWEQNPSMIVLGNHSRERVTIFSFVVRHPGTGKFVHYNFIATLLNDLFGIQSRGGCACAGPYGHDLLGITEPMAKRIKWFTNENIGMDSSCPMYPVGIMRPGFVRVNLPYFYDDETVDYIITAVDIVSTHGWKLLPQYTFDAQNGSFVYKGDDTHPEEALYSLRDLDYTKKNGGLHINRKPPDVTHDVTLQDMLREGEQRLLEADNVQVRKSSASRRLFDLIPKDKRKLRWFLTPQEVTDFITGARKVKCFKPVMAPRGDVNEPRAKHNFIKENVKDHFVKEPVKDNFVKENGKDNSVRETGKEHFLKERFVNKNLKEHFVKGNAKDRSAEETVKGHVINEKKKEHVARGNVQEHFVKEKVKDNLAKANANDHFVKENVNEQFVKENVNEQFVKEKLKLKDNNATEDVNTNIVKANIVKESCVETPVSTSRSGGSNPETEHGYRDKFRRLKEAARRNGHILDGSVTSRVSKPTQRDDVTDGNMTSRHLTKHDNGSIAVRKRIYSMDDSRTRRKTGSESDISKMTEVKNALENIDNLVNAEKQKQTDKRIFVRSKQSLSLRKF